MVIDEKENSALTIIARLRTAGFIAVLAGGCVRDRILGVTPKDYDIATDARPETVQALFDNTVAVGARFGVIMVILGDHHFEVATFRADAEYLDGRRPSSVRYGTIEEDVQRRDFTIGGMYFDPATKTQVLNAVGGVMAPDGLLLLGGRETVLGLTDKFKPMEGQNGVYIPSLSHGSAAASQMAV